MTSAYKLGAIKVIVKLLSHRAFIAPIADRVCDPLIDGGLMPTCAVDADLHLVGKSAFLDLAVERGAANAGKFLKSNARTLKSAAWRP